MEGTSVFVTLIVIICVFLYLAYLFKQDLPFLKWFFILMIIPLLTALASVNYEYNNCLLVHHDNVTYGSHDVTLECAPTKSPVSLWLVKIMLFLMRVEVILAFIGLLVIAYQRMVEKGGYIK